MATSRWAQYAQQDNGMVAIIEHGTSRITLQVVEKNDRSGRCYHAWNTRYKVLETNVEVTQDLLNAIQRGGIFLGGQVSVVQLEADGTIRWYGECDSSD